jgi:hypothetical protein
LQHDAVGATNGQLEEIAGVPRICGRRVFGAIARAVRIKVKGASAAVLVFKPNCISQASAMPSRSKSGSTIRLAVALFPMPAALNAWQEVALVIEVRASVNGVIPGPAQR